jgi:hypothetical protein
MSLQDLHSDTSDASDIKPTFPQLCRSRVRHTETRVTHVTHVTTPTTTTPPQTIARPVSRPVEARTSRSEAVA